MIDRGAWLDALRASCVAVEEAAAAGPLDAAVPWCAGLDPDAETSTWCSYDTKASFWWRRMAHETAIHAVDVLEAVGWSWPVPEALAVDGVDEALRLWLGVALGRTWEAPGRSSASSRRSGPGRSGSTTTTSR